MRGHSVILAALCASGAISVDRARCGLNSLGFLEVARVPPSSAPPDRDRAGDHALCTCELSGWTRRRRRCGSTASADIVVCSKFLIIAPWAVGRAPPSPVRAPLGHRGACHGRREFCFKDGVLGGTKGALVGRIIDSTRRGVAPPLRHRDGAGRNICALPRISVLHEHPRLIVRPSRQRSRGPEAQSEA